MHRTKAALMMALLGALLFAAFALQDIRIHPEIPAGELPWDLILRYAVGMTLGGALAGVAFSGLFGRSGIGGWVLTLLSGVIAAAVSGLLGSAIGLLPDLSADGLTSGEIFQIVVGLLVLPFAIAEEPWLIAPIAALLVGTHLWCRAARKNSATVAKRAAVD